MSGKSAIIALVSLAAGPLCAAPRGRMKASLPPPLMPSVLITPSQAAPIVGSPFIAPAGTLGQNALPAGPRGPLMPGLGQLNMAGKPDNGGEAAQQAARVFDNSGSGVPGGGEPPDGGDPPGGKEPGLTAKRRQKALRLYHLAGGGVPYESQISPDGRKLYVRYEQMTGRIYDLEKGKLLMRLPGRFIRRVEFSHDSRLISVQYASPFSYAVFDLDQRVPLIHDPYFNGPDIVYTVMFSPKTRWAVVRHLGNFIQVFDFRDWEKPVFAAGANDAQISPDERWILARYEDGTSDLFDLLDLRNPAPKLRFSAGGSPRFSPKGSKLLFSPPEGAVRLFDLSGDAPVETQHSIPRISVNFSPDGRWLLVDDLPKSRVIDPASVEDFDSVTGLTNQILFSPDGQWMGVVRQDRSQVIFRMPSQGKDSLEIPVELPDGAIAWRVVYFSPKGRWAFIPLDFPGRSGPSGLLYDLESGRRIIPSLPPVEPDSAASAEFSPDERWAFVENGRGNGTLLDLEHGRVVVLPPGLGGFHAFFSADSKLVRLGDAQGITRIIDLEAFAEDATLVETIQRTAQP